MVALGRLRPAVCRPRNLARLALPPLPTVAKDGLSWRAVSTIGKDDATCRLARKTHIMCHHDHGRVVACERARDDHAADTLPVGCTRASSNRALAIASLQKNASRKGRRSPVHVLPRCAPEPWASEPWASEPWASERLA